MNNVKKFTPIIIVIVIACLAAFLSRHQISIEFNTGMPVESIEGLKNALDKLIK